MIPNLVAHLWQSTLFAAVAALVVLCLRANRAHVRYWVWFAASAKFLVPFSLLVGLGALVPHRAPPPPVDSEWVAALQEFSQPFPIPAVSQTVPPGAARRYDLATAALIVWACGVAAIAICWLLRWRHVHTLRTSARAVSVPTSLAVPLPILAAPHLIEPGVFGILRPVLLLPEGIAGQLSQSQLDAVLIHEFCHLRRQDNLTAALHMVVQAIFWFHPLTWWLGARLVEERERACDEEVLRLGCRPNIYAESILTVCKLYLSSPLPCVSGVTGAHLQGRIESIMRNRGVIRLNLTKRLALAIAALTTLLLPVIIGVLHPPAIQAQDPADWQAKAGGKMAFEVASVKLSTGQFVPPAFPLDTGNAYRPTGGHFRADFPLWTYITFAYKIWPAEDQRREILSHLPKWVTTDRYSIEARVPGTPTKDQMRLMVQSLLAGRFQLAVHFETREAPVFALTLVKPGKMGPDLRLHSEGPPCHVIGGSLTGRGAPAVFPAECEVYAALRAHGANLMGSRNTAMDLLASSLSFLAGTRPLIDRTGLTERVDFRLEFTPEPPASAPPNTEVPPPDPSAPTFLQALRDQLGLKLESTRAPVQILVVDKVERPSEN